MSIHFCKHGHPIFIRVTDQEEIRYIKLKEKEKRKREREAQLLLRGRRLPPPPPPPPLLPRLRGGSLEATKIQAWWRGTLVRRTLLHAALQAWIIQRWWRRTLWWRRRRCRRELLVSFAIQEWAVVKLQSLVRMWRVHWRYAQVLSAIYAIRCHWQSHRCQTCALLRGHCVVTATHLQFHIEVTGA